MTTWFRPDVYVQPVIAGAWDFPHGHRLAQHVHDGGQFVYAASGVMSVTTAQAAYVVPPQRAVWIPPRIGHEIRMSGIVAMRTVYVEPSLAATLPAACAVVAVRPLLRELICAATEIAQPCPPDSAESRLFATLLDEIRAAPAAPLHLPMPRDEHLRAVATAMQLAPADPRGLEAWAREAGMSARTLARTFVAETGMTFGAWRQQLRLMEAMRLLAGGASVTAAALACGYDSTSAFIGMFRRATGQPPGRYFAGMGEGVGG